MKFTPANKSIIFPLVFFLLLMNIIFFGGCSLLNIQVGPQMSALEENIVSGDGNDKLLIIEIEGIISNQDRSTVLGSKIDAGMVERVREVLQKAENDDYIKAILLRINSPGGTVTSSDIIFHELISFKNRTGIKVYAILMDVAASGGYYIALAADKIIAHPTSITGSIGVIAMKVNMEGLMEKIGVEMEIVKSGDKKDFLSPMRPFTEEERRLFQKTIDDYHDRFVRLISENRTKLDYLKSQDLADGRVYNSRQALMNGLIDEIGYMDDAIGFMRRDMGIENFLIVSYHRKGVYKSNIYSSISHSQTINLWNFHLFQPGVPTGPMFMYVWAP